MLRIGAADPSSSIAIVSAASLFRRRTNEDLSRGERRLPSSGTHTSSRQAERESSSGGRSKGASRGSTTDAHSSVLILQRLREGPGKTRGGGSGRHAVGAHRTATCQLARLREDLGELTKPVDRPADVLAP